MRENARQEAFLHLEEIVARDPATALYLPLAERLLERGRLEEAIQLCEGRRNRPGRGVGDHIVLGRAYLADGRLDDARAEMEAALALDRENVVALKALAGILSHQGDHKLSASYYRAVCRVDPGDLESQTALHQITSGEFPEVRPPDIVVGQGEMTWQPIQLPREEEHLSELGLGLHTIETFEGGAAPVPYKANVHDYQELSIERLDTETATEPRAAATAETAPPPMELHPAGAPQNPPAVPGTSAVPPVPPSSPPAAPQEASPPVPGPPPKTGAIVEGNKSAFELWLRQLGGRNR